MKNMERYNPQKHHRRSIRLAGYDYSQAGLYFVTLVCQDRAYLFGGVKNSIMHLNEFGQIAADEWLHTQEVRDNVVLHEFVIMPNHIHGIIEITFSKNNGDTIGVFQSPSQTIGAIVRGYKIATIKRIKELISKGGYSKGELQFAPTAPTAPTTEIIKSLEYKIWQRNYYEHIIRDEQAHQNISKYIIDNPLKWKEDQLNIP